MRHDLDAIYTSEHFRHRKREPYHEYCEVLERSLCPTSFLDLGCAAGFTVEYFSCRGIRAIGVEGASAAFDFMPGSVKGLVTKHDLRLPLDLGERFDVVNCTEVAEHLEPEFEDMLIGNILRHASRLVVFTASPVWDKARGTPRQSHWNVQPRDYWAKRLTRESLLVREDLIREVRRELSAKKRTYPWWREG